MNSPVWLRVLEIAGQLLVSQEESVGVLLLGPCLVAGGCLPVQEVLVVFLSFCHPQTPLGELILAVVMQMLLGMYGRWLGACCSKG